MRGLPACELHEDAGEVRARRQIRLPASRLVQPGPGYQPHSYLLASFSIENLLNAQYFGYLESLASVALPGVDITYKAALKVRFGRA